MGALAALVVIAVIAAVAAGGFSRGGDRGDQKGEDRATGTTTGSASSATPPRDPPTLPAGKWVVIVESLAQTEFTLEQARARATTKSEALGGVSVEVVDSVGDAGLQDGYWALIVGTYDSQDDAEAACGDLGLQLGSNCYAKQAGG